MRVLPALGRLALACFVAAFLVGATASIGTRMGAFDLHVGLDVLLHWTVYLALAGLVLGLAWVVLAIFSHDRAAGRAGLAGLIGSALVLAFPLYNYYALQTSPPLHDISTDLATPPQFMALLPLRKGAENAPDFAAGAKVRFEGKTATAGEWQRKFYPDIFTLRLLVPPSRLYKRALRAVQLMGWHIVAASPDEGRIEATDTSFFFGLTDDIVIRVRPSGAGAKLDIRSESRFGRNDAGRNAAAIRAFLKTLKRG